MPNETEVKPNGRQALGRTLADMAEPTPPRFLETKREVSEEEQAGNAIPAIIRILSALPEAQCANVFAAVQAIRQTARRSSSEIARIGDELTRIEKEKAQRNTQAPKRRGWWRRAK